jgi:hypothetical protein
MMTLIERASALARDLRDARVDHNEAQKALAYLRINRDGQGYFAYLQAIVQNGRVVIRSNKTIGYYRNLLELSRRHLRNLPPEDMTATLAWAIRLLRYYKEVPEAERQGLDVAPAAAPSAPQGDNAARTSTGSVRSPGQPAASRSSSEARHDPARAPTDSTASPGQPAASGESSIHQKIPQKGEVFRGKVLEVGEDAVMIQVYDFDADQVVGVMRAETIAGNDTSRYREGNEARVEVIEVRKKDARIILELKPAPRKK